MIQGFPKQPLGHSRAWVGMWQCLARGIGPVCQDAVQATDTAGAQEPSQSV